jgi:two-component system response regulator RegA
MGRAGHIRSVLVVDDDERLLAALRRTLRAERSVFTATTPDDATRIARRVTPDLVIVDLQLGSHSGLDVVRTLKHELPTTLFALVSGYLTVDTTVAAVRAGADIVLTKPVRGAEILRRAERGDFADDEPFETPTLAQAESEHIARVIEDCGGNISEAARRLGIYRSSLQRKLRKRTPLP